MLDLIGDAARNLRDSTDIIVREVTRLRTENSALRLENSQLLQTKKTYITDSPENWIQRVVVVLNELSEWRQNRLNKNLETETLDKAIFVIEEYSRFRNNSLRDMVTNLDKRIKKLEQ